MSTKQFYHFHLQSRHFLATKIADDTIKIYILGTGTIGGAPQVAEEALAKLNKRKEITISGLPSRYKNDEEKLKEKIKREFRIE